MAYRKLRPGLARRRFLFRRRADAPESKLRVTSGKTWKLVVPTEDAERFRRGELRIALRVGSDDLTWNNLDLWN